MKTYVQKPQPMTTYDAPAPYGKRQIALRTFIEAEADMLEQFKLRIKSVAELNLDHELERRQEFLSLLVLLEKELRGR